MVTAMCHVHGRLCHRCRVRRLGLGHSIVWPERDLCCCLCSCSSVGLLLLCHRLLGVRGQLTSGVPMLFELKKTTKELVR